MITIPTHYSNSTIDNIISNSDHITHNGTIDTDITDHRFYFLYLHHFLGLKNVIGESLRLIGNYRPLYDYL